MGCCYGCHNSCYRPGYSNCERSMDRQYYRDDLMMESGFIPQDIQPFPLSIRIFSVAGPGYSETAICPPPACADVNCSIPTDTDIPNDIFVTLTEMQELGDTANLSHGPPCLHLALGLAVAHALLRSVWGG